MSDVYDELNEANYKLELHMEAIEKIRDEIDMWDLSSSEIAGLYDTLDEILIDLREKLKK
jgi:hypothetical protein